MLGKFRVCPEQRFHSLYSHRSDLILQYFRLKLFKIDTVTRCPKKDYFCLAEGFSSDECKKEKYGYMTDVRFYPFQTQKKLLSKENAGYISQEERNTNQNETTKKLFYLHSMDCKPFGKHPYPQIFAYNNFKESLKVYNNVN